MNRLLVGSLFLAIASGWAGSLAVALERVPKDGRPEADTSPLTSTLFLEEFRAGIKALADKDLVKAEASLRITLANAERPGAPVEEQVGCLSGLSMACILGKKFPEAETYLNRALTLQKPRRQTDPLGGVPLLLMLAECGIRQNHAVEADRFLREALARQEEALGGFDLRLVPTLKAIAMIGAGPAVEAKLKGLVSGRGINGGEGIDAPGFSGPEIALTRALKIQERVLGKDHADLAETLQMLIRVYDEIGQPQISEALLLRLIAIQQKSLGPSHPDVIGAVAWLGYKLSLQKKHRQAELVFKQGLDALKGDGRDDERMWLTSGFQRAHALSLAEASSRLPTEEDFVYGS